ncbi:MAG: hypothetical protein JSR82_24815 [Verrucomicrobia bacterium]|nr:hypothetical protein [Verrucomicrobiota bacterium]
MEPPSDMFTAGALLEWAGEKTFQRGESYFREGRVRSFHRQGQQVSARVTGKRPYKVKLWAQPGGSLEYSCECSTGREGRLCVHCVAVALAWLDGGRVSSAPDPVREHLESLPRERLLELLVEATDYDSILRRRLLLERELNRPRQTPDAAEWKRLLKEAIVTKDYIDFEGLPDYAQGIEEVLAPLGALLDQPQPPAALVVELCEFALERMDDVSDLADFGDPALSELWHHLQNWHLRAARLDQNGDRAELARRLLQRELQSTLGTFRDAAVNYADVLGPDGLRAYAAALTHVWERVPPMGPGDRPVEVTQERVQITSLMERIAARAGSWPAQLAVRLRDLSTPHDFVAIAEGWRRQGRAKDAVLWAERGWEAFRGRSGQAEALRELLAELYLEVGRGQEAIAIAWERFAAQPSRRTYELWLDQAGRAGEPSESARERALAHLRTRPSGAGADASLLVELLLQGGRDDEAWQAAQEHGCSPQEWLRLADRRESRHPTESLAIYRRAAETCLEAGSSASYREAAEHIAKVRRLMERLGHADEFEEYRADLRRRNQHRRLFVRLLDSLA